MGDESEKVCVFNQLLTTWRKAFGEMLSSFATTGPKKKKKKLLDVAKAWPCERLSILQQSIFGKSTRKAVTDGFLRSTSSATTKSHSVHKLSIRWSFPTLQTYLSCTMLQASNVPSFKIILLCVLSLRHEWNSVKQMVYSAEETHYHGLLTVCKSTARCQYKSVEKWTDTVTPARFESAFSGHKYLWVEMSPHMHNISRYMSASKLPVKQRHQMFHSALHSFQHQ